MKIKIIKENNKKLSLLLMILTLDLFKLYTNTSNYLDILSNFSF